MLVVLGLGAAALAGPPAALAQQAETPSPASQRPLSAIQKRQIVEAAAAAYADHYVFEEDGRRIAEHLRRQQARGAFDAASTPEAFAAALTAAIRTVKPDRHIEIVAPRAAAASASAPATPSRAERLAWVDRLRRRNFDFIRAERLPGNVGLLRLDSFPPPEVAAPTATAAMAFLSHSDAMIIDLRENGGGTGDMVRLLASYFFVEPTRLSRTFRRNREPRIAYDMTLTTLPGERMPLIDLFILTSPRTFSAAEAFAFSLQQLGRAVVVGETTGGGGNAGDYIDLGHGFTAFVPDVHVSAPYEETSWEGRGVQPNLAAAADNALNVAHRDAVQRLLAAATQQADRDRLQRALDALPN